MFKGLLSKQYPKSTLFNQLSIKNLSEQCRTCSGYKRVKSKCRVCKGSKKCANHRCSQGQVKGYVRKKSQFVLQARTCNTCVGSGDCHKCSGTGQTNHTCSRCNGMGLTYSSQRAVIVLKELLDKNLVINKSRTQVANKKKVTKFEASLKRYLNNVKNIKNHQLFIALYPKAPKKSKQSLIALGMLGAIIQKHPEEYNSFRKKMSSHYPESKYLKLILIDTFKENCADCKGSKKSPRTCSQCNSSKNSCQNGSCGQMVKCIMCRGRGSFLDKIKAYKFITQVLNSIKNDEDPPLNPLISPL